MGDSNHQPLVSVVIPCYNGERFIQATIGSVQSQTYSNFEIIVIDDGSTDSSSEILRSLIEKDDRIIYTHQQNAGVSAARNKGMSIAKGEYIALLDADDIWCKDNLEKKVRFLEQNKDTDWVFSDMYMADADLKDIKMSEPGTDADILNNLLLWEGEVVPGPCSNIVFRKKCLLSGISFNKKLSTTADFDFCIQLAVHFKGRRIPEPLWIYRVLSTSMSKNISLMENDHLLIYKNVSKQKLFKSYWFKRKCYSNNYLIIGGSWWVNGNNKAKGMLYVIMALLHYPLNIKKILKKVVS
ncbi:MAG TPA: glycosyltransferase [Bacteroidia bacterium]|jgi:glycosyltransferase involved in cell wall biosynthesis